MKIAMKIRILTLSFLLLSVAPALAADAGYTETSIDLPTSAEIAQKDDYSARVFAQLLGPAWTAICGPNSGGIGQYSGLILAILQAISWASTTAIGIIIMYQAAIAAVATAHDGKRIGGSTAYDSLWSPVRWATGFMLSVPVLHGLSLLQILIIASIGVGINGGNIIWQTASTYVIEHVGKDDASTDTQSQIIDSEALEAVQPLFSGVVLQEVFKARGRGETFSHIREFKEPNLQSRWRTIEIYGDYVIEHRPLESEAILWIRPYKKDLGTFGGISIPAPQAKLEGGKVTAGEDLATYEAALAVTRIRIDEMIRMAESLRPWAKWHIATGMEREDGRVQRPSGDGLDIAETYRRNVSEAMRAHIEAAGGNRQVSEKLADALGQKAKGQTPAGGWMGAGVLPTILSYAVREADIINYGSGVRPVIINTTDGTYSEKDGTMSRFAGWWRDDLMVDDFHILKLQTSAKFATQYLLAGRSWSGHDAEGNSAGVINQVVTWMFTDANLSNNGILSSTIRDFNEKNPISAIIDFGGHCLTVAAWAMGASVVAGLLSAIPGAAGALAGLVNNGLFLAAIGGLGCVGILCCFVAPLTPLLIWARACLGWIIHVTLALFGAPLLAIATVFPEGAGFIGQHARKGYTQLLDIAIRPAVMTGCLCAAYVLLRVWVMILTMLFSKFTNASAGYATTGVVWQLGMSVIFITLVYSAIHLLFKTLVLSGPTTIITWIGGIGMSISSIENAADRDGSTAGGMGSKLAAGAAGAGAGAAGIAGAFSQKNDKDGDKGSQGGDKGSQGGQGGGIANIAPKGEE